MRLAILSFACGVLLLQSQAELPEPWVLASLGLAGFLSASLGAYGRQSRKAAVAQITLMAGAAALGFAWAGALASWRLADQLPIEWETKPIELTGVVASLPQRFERGERFEFDVEAVHTADATVPSHIMLSWYRSWDDVDETDNDDEARAIRPGERWRFTVKLKRPHGNANPHGFDYEAWLLERNVRATGTIRSRSDVQRIDGFVWRPSYAVERLREGIRGRFLSALPGAPYVGVLVALSVGDQRSIPGGAYQI
jgi:competence protein ComEC